MSADALLVVLLMAVAVASSIVLVWGHGLSARAVLPMLLFVVFEVSGTWFVLIPGVSSAGLLPGIAVSVGLVLSLLAYRVFGPSPRDIRNAVRRWRDERPRSVVIVRPGVRSVILLVAALFAIAAFEFRGLPPIGSLLSALVDPTGGSDTIAEVREFRRSATKSHLFGGEYRGQGLIRIFVEVGWRYVVVLAFGVLWCYRRSTHNPSRWLQALPVVVTVFGALVLASTGIRSPLVLTLITVAIAYSLLHRVKSRHVVRYIVVFVALLLFISPLSKGERGGVTLEERVVAMSDRISSGNAAVNVTIVELVREGDLAYGQGQIFVERVVAMLPGVWESDRPFASRLTALSGVASTGSTAYATPTQFGLLFADGGYAGVIAGYLFTGACLGWVTRRLLRVDLDDPYSLALVAQVILAAGYWAITGVHGFVTAFGVAYLIHVLAKRVGTFGTTKRIPARVKVLG